MTDLRGKVVEFVKNYFKRSSEEFRGKRIDGYYRELKDSGLPFKALIEAMDSMMGEASPPWEADVVRRAKEISERKESEQGLTFIAAVSKSLSKLPKEAGQAWFDSYKRGEKENPSYVEVWKKHGIRYLPEEKLPEVSVTIINPGERALRWIEKRKEDMAWFLENYGFCEKVFAVQIQNESSTFLEEIIYLLKPLGYVCTKKADISIFDNL